MIVGQRIRDLLDQIGMSQSELARRVSVNQSTIAGLLSGKARSSTKLHQIARELGTTPAFLSGETDDPGEGAPPPPPTPTVQHVMMQVALPSERALAEMFLGVLQASRRMSEDELARELAKRLPTGLQLLRGRLIYEDQDLDAGPVEVAEAPASARRERRRA